MGQSQTDLARCIDEIRGAMWIIINYAKHPSAGIISRDARTWLSKAFGLTNREPATRNLHRIIDKWFDPSLRSQLHKAVNYRANPDRDEGFQNQNAKTLMTNYFQWQRNIVENLPEAEQDEDRTLGIWANEFKDATRIGAPGYGLLDLINDMFTHLPAEDLATVKRFIMDTVRVKEEVMKLPSGNLDTWNNDDVKLILSNMEKLRLIMSKAVKSLHESIFTRVLRFITGSGASDNQKLGQNISGLFGLRLKHNLMEDEGKINDAILGGVEDGSILKR